MLGELFRTSAKSVRILLSCGNLALSGANLGVSCGRAPRCRGLPLPFVTWAAAGGSSCGGVAAARLSQRGALVPAGGVGGVVSAGVSGRWQDISAGGMEVAAGLKCRRRASFARDARSTT
jgi:hypothetical protein